jgi:hypothetical protein
MPARHQHIILKLLVSAAIALVRLVGGAAPASADPDPGRTGPNPCGGIASSCQETYPAGSPEQREEIDRESEMACLPGRRDPTNQDRARGVP